MAYTVLARRYRSATFDDVIGQARVAQTLKKAIDTHRVAHAYLFCGTRGTGKTSMARILAKALNCEASDGPTSSPCLKCSSCVGIARGDDIDCIEVDAASNTRLEDTQQVILDHVNYRPSRARYRIFIIDEVHMLSRHSFNALLKTLEEPPEHAKFILATTDPQKVPNTILSRCQRYDFRNIPTKEIARHLSAICASENVNADAAAVAMVAKAGAGSMRDALSLLDRVLSAGESSIDAEGVERLVGLPRGQAVFEIVDAVGRADVARTLEKSEAMLAAGFTADALAGAMIEHLRNLMVLRVCGAASDLVDAPGIDPGELAAQASGFDPGDLSQDIVLLEELRRSLRQSVAGRALLDATLVRIALAGQFMPVDQAIRAVSANRTPTAGSGTDEKKKTVRVTPADPSPHRSTAPAKTSASSPSPVGTDRAPSRRGGGSTANARDASAAAESAGHAHDTPAASGSTANAGDASAATEPAGLVHDASAAAQSADDDSDDALPAVGRVWDGPSLKDALAASAKLSGSNVEPVDPADMPESWLALLSLLSKTAPSVHGTIRLGRFGGVDATTLTVLYDERQKPMFQRLENGRKRQIDDAATEVFGQSMGVRFVAETVEPASQRDERSISPAEGRGSGSTAAVTRGGSASPSTAAHPHDAEDAAGRGPATRPAAARPVVIPPARVTDEQRKRLYDENPVVRAVIDAFAAEVVRIDPDDPEDADDPDAG